MADTFERQLVKTKEFTPDQAGQRVGWASAMPIPDRDDLVSFNVVSATVGPEGAYHSYYDDEISGERMRTYSNYNSRGFLHVAGLAVLINREMPIHQTNRDFRYTDFGDAHPDTNSLIRSGASGYSNRAPEDEAKIWVNSREALLELLKAQLAETKTMGYYPPIYYLMNALFTHQSIVQKASYRDENPRSLVLADPSMASSTRDQIANASQILADLKFMTEADKKMLTNLTVFGDVPAASIPEAFIESRRLVAKHERAVLNASNALAFPALVYIPRSSNWPYMDGTAETEQAAYGRELSALKKKDTTLANYELERELESIEKRIVYAKQGFQALNIIAAAEKSAR